MTNEILKVVEIQTNDHLQTFFNTTSESVAAMEYKIPEYTQVTPSILSSQSLFLYKKMYEKDLIFTLCQEEAVEDLKNKMKAMKITCNGYATMRRIQKKIDKYISTNRVNDFIGADLYLPVESDLSEYKLARGSQILDFHRVVNKKTSTAMFLGNDSLFGDLYEINPIETKNHNTIFTVRYELNGLSLLNLFQTTLICPRFDIDKVVFYKDKYPVEAEYEIETLRETITLIFKKTIEITHVDITFTILKSSTINTQKDSLVSVGKTIYANKKKYVDIVEQNISLHGTNNKFLLEQIDSPSFNYVSASEYNYSIPTVNDRNEKIIRALHYIKNYMGDVVVLYPKPIDMATVVVKHNNIEVQQIIKDNNLISGNSFNLTNAFYKLIGASVNDKITFEYTSQESVSKYYQLSHIRNNLIYHCQLSKVIIKLAGSEAFGNLLSVTADYLMENKKNAVQLGKIIETIVYDGVEREISEIIYPENMYYYKEKKIVLPIMIPNSGHKIDLKEIYRPGMIKAYTISKDKYIEYPIQDWVDDPDLSTSECRIFIDNKIYDNITIFYSPLSKESEDVVSNFTIVKNSEIITNAKDGIITIAKESLSIDSYISSTWNNESGILKSPFFNTIFYEPVYAADKIESFYVDSNGNVEIKLENTDIHGEYKLQTYNDKKVGQITINMVLVLPGINPIVILEELSEA